MSETLACVFAVSGCVARRVSAGFAVSLMLLSIGPGSASALKLAVMGDSLSDEYEETSYGSYAENWIEQLEIYAALDLGLTATEAGQPGGTWGEPRRTQWAYNWARSGANSATLLSEGQHTGLASQVAPAGIDFAIMVIGANDFHPAGAAYVNIYNGLWSAAAITSYVNGVLANINSALDTVLPTGVPLVLVNAPDYGITPTVIAAYPNPSQRQNVADAISELNAGMETIAMTRGLVYIDFYSATKVIFGEHASPNASISIGNVSISLSASDTSGGGNPTAGFVDDGVHPNTTLQGIFANTILEALNLGYGAGLALFSESEILAHRGIPYGGSDTLAAQYGAYSTYVTTFAAPAVPSLSPLGVILACLLLLGTSIEIRRRGWMRSI